MLQTRNKTSFATALVPTLDLENRGKLTVVVKGTFALGRNQSLLPIADEQAPICFAPVFNGEPGRSSVRYEADTCPSKPNTDVVMVGSARAARFTTEMDVELRVGELHKIVRVFGDRHWTQRARVWRASAPTPFRVMPLVYERAFGGDGEDREPRNPVGVGLKRAASDADPDGAALPNLEDPRQLIQSRSTRPRPAGFGFVAPDWQPRPSFAGTFDAAWQRGRCPLLPADFDARYFQGAAPDLVARGHLSGGEPVEIRGVSEAGPLVFRIPTHRLTVTLSVKGDKQSARPVLDTVLIEPDERRVVLSWRVTLPCGGNILYVDWVRIEEA